MNNDLKEKEAKLKENMQSIKGSLGKIGSFLKRRWKLGLVVLVVFYAISLAGNPDFQEGVEKGKEITEKKEENKPEEVKESEPEVAPVKEETPEEKEAREKKEQEEAKIKKEEEEARAKKEQEEARTANIEKQFSDWNGQHVKLTKLIKESMNDPKSYEHVKTVYFDMEDHLIINTTFRGSNAFGGTVTNTAKGKASIDGENVELLEIL